MSHLYICPFDGATLSLETKLVTAGQISRYTCPNGDYVSTWGLDAAGLVEGESTSRTANPAANVKQVVAGGGGGGSTDVTDRAARLLGKVAVDNLPATQPVSGSVSVSNLPATQPVSGTVSVGNFPATQPVSGTVTANTGLTQPLTDTQLRATAVPVSGFPAVQPVSDNGGSLTVDGTVNVGNFPATQPVSGTVTANTGLTQPLTDTQLRATAVPVSGTFWQTTQPVSGTVTANTGLTQPLTDTQLRATAVPVSLASAPTTPVTGTFWQATQPVSGPLTDTQLRATAVPVTNGHTQPLTDAQLRASNVPVWLPTATLVVTATGAAAAAVTLTLPAPGVGLFHYITSIEITAYNTAARTGTATPVIVTTTNLPGTPAFTFASAGAIGTTDRHQPVLSRPLRSAVANTATTIVGPATASVIWRMNVSYYTAA